MAWEAEIRSSQVQVSSYIRFWEYSCGRGNFPDWSIIIVRSNFKENQEENLKDLARFFKEYMAKPNGSGISGF